MGFGKLITPIGPVSVLSSEGSIAHIHLGDLDETVVLTPEIETTLQELKAYFNGDLHQFSVPFHMEGTDFQKRVWKALLEIPYGHTISYSDLAITLGDIKCIRAAGTANGKNKLPILIPCHRVIGKDGSLVGFAGGLDKKTWLLQHEGVLKGVQMDIFG